MSVVDMGKHGGGSRWVVVGLAMLFISAGSLPGFGQELRRLSIPLPVEIDGQPRHTSLYLKVEMKSIDQPFDKFAAGPTDKAEAMFVKAVQSVRKNDVAGFDSVWTAPDEMKSRGQTKVAMMSNNTPDGWLKVIRGMFDF